MRILVVVERLISDDPGQSLRKLASIVGVSELIIHRIVEEDLRYNSYTLKIRQMLRLSEQAEGSPLLPFWPPNSPDLNSLDYYI